MAELQKADLDKISKEMIALYWPREGQCKATPAQMNLLLKRLRDYTEEVRQAALKTSIVADENTAQWVKDMQNWQARLARYQKYVDQAPKEHWYDEDGCAAVYQEVTAPVVQGIWYEELPGISLSDAEKEAMVKGVGHGQFGVDVSGEHPPGHSNPKPPDFHVPFTLGNQVIEYRKAQKERLEKFWTDLKSEATKLQEKAAGVLEVAHKALPWTALILGLVALVWIVYIVRAAQREKHSR